MLLVGGKLSLCLLERMMLRHKCLRHVVEQAGRCLLEVLLEQGRALRIPRSGLRRRFVKLLEQLIDGLLILLVHLMPPSRAVIARVSFYSRVEHYRAVNSGASLSRRPATGPFGIMNFEGDRARSGGARTR